MNKTVRFTIAGFGGQGVMLLGQLIAHAGARVNLNSLWFPSYGPETRGGTANCAVTVSPAPINSPVYSRADVLIALNKPSYERFKEKVAPGGIILYNSSLFEPEDVPENVKIYGVPVNDIAKELGNIRVANMVMLGAYLALSPLFEDEVIHSVLSDLLGAKKESMLALNVEAVEAGKRYIAGGREMITDFNALLNKCKALPRKRLVVCGGEDEAAQLAVKRAADIGLVSPILVGSAGKIKEIMTVTGLSADVIGTETPEEASAAAVRLVREGEGDILMKGMIDTGALLKAVVNRETGIRLSSLLSHVTVFSVPTLDKLLLATDCAMVIAPDFADKIGIIENAAIVARVLGIAVPKVAVLSASEKVNPKMLSSEEAAALARHFAGREDLIVAGPYALDNVISEEAARRKGIAGGAAGSADVIVFPGIEAGNVFYKTAVYLAGATPAGVVIGARAPIALTSRADSEQAKFYSIALAMVVENETDNSRD